MKNIVCFGDSITSGFNFPNSKTWPGFLQAELDALSVDYDVYNRGIGGNTTINALDRFDADVKEQLPAWVIIEFGFNDGSIRAGRSLARCNVSAFQDNLAEIVQLVRAKKGKPILLTNHPIAPKFPTSKQGNGRDYTQNFKPYQPAIRAVAKKHKVPLIDLEKTMRKAGVRYSDLVCEDGMHLSREGNFIYAQFVLDGLRPLLGLK
ncbi:MAG: SGNH/GDSL hydrolase family protein [Chthoniobacterales bacterium]